MPDQAWHSARIAKTLNTIPVDKRKLPDEYRTQLAALASNRDGKEWLARALQTNDPSQTARVSNTRAFYEGYTSVTCTSPSQLIETAKASTSGHCDVCVIENIDDEWICALGAEWNIDMEFFLAHDLELTMDRRQAWTNIFGSTIGSGASSWRSPPEVTDLYEQQHRHISGAFEYHNWRRRDGGTNQEKSYMCEGARLSHFFPRLFWESPAPQASCKSTRISYCRPFPRLYLILIDASVDPSSFSLTRYGRERPTLRFPCSKSRGGLVIPQLFSNPSHSLYETLQKVFQHGWHFAVLFDGLPQITNRMVLPPSHLLYMISVSMAESNFRHLNAEIRRISFEDIREPNVETNNILHDLRQDLIVVQDMVSEAKRYVPRKVLKAYVTMSKTADWPMALSLTELFQDLSERIDKLESFLMDSFQLLISSISVIDSRTSLQQSTRGAILTKLALIYVPLSFVTGIFGMNIREINHSPLSVWVCFVAIIVVVVATVIAFWALKPYERWKDERRARKMTSSGDGFGNQTRRRHRVVKQRV